MVSRRQTLKTLAATSLFAILPNSLVKAAQVGENRFHPFDFEKRTVTLNNGIEMPIIGIGMWTLSPEQAEKSVTEALKSGYRLIDTARMYRNEEAVGRAVRNSGIPRDQIFITTKIYGSRDYADAEKAINERLKLLDTDYIDLLLLHYPDTHDTEAWKVMEKFVQAGKLRAIGLSNYHQKTFGDIMKVATVTPAVVQNEVHIYNQDKHTKAFLRQYGTQMEAWYPLGGRNSYGNGGKDVLFADPTIVATAKAHNKTPAQILLRWQLQAGNIAIPGSSNPAHIKENIAIFDFALSEKEMAQISNLDKQTKFSTFGNE
ncbi:aldo/keto reductase [Chelonobacter oris]|uniref:Aldo/keto reductase n=1 Tax=Chelonobacter oris TaxID=505317 RepID=A0A0A3B9E8_9PAST|nr:aldo/keto reductase [Chelonobacter oris]KGQ70164.1 aldo/keto reductase [Chelonobacter oris]